MALLRSDGADSLIVRSKLAESALPTNRDIVEHCYHIQQLLVDAEAKFLKQILGLNDKKNIVITDAVEL